MGAVQDDFRATGYVFQAARPARLPDALLDGRGGNSQTVQHGCGGARVFHLVLASERAGRIERRRAAESVKREPNAVSSRLRICHSLVRISGASISRARADSAASASGCWAAITAGTRGFRMPAFSPAIASRLLPSQAS